MGFRVLQLLAFSSFLVPIDLVHPHASRDLEKQCVRCINDGSCKQSETQKTHLLHILVEAEWRYVQRRLHILTSMLGQACQLEVSGTCNYACPVQSDAQFLSMSRKTYRSIRLPTKLHPTWIPKFNVFRCCCLLPERCGVRALKTWCICLLYHQGFPTNVYFDL